MAIGRFIIECDPEHFDVAKDAVIFLQDHPEDRQVMTTATYGDNDIEVHMYAMRLKKSIRVRQVRP